MKEQKDLRITGGWLRGRKISTPGGVTHPMGERERLALFNMLGSRLTEATILDIFAGSGALGIEALSRGASFAVFVDKSSEAIRTISHNLKLLDLKEKSNVIKCAISQIPTEIGPFDIVLADPPYDNFVIENLQFVTNFVSKGGLFVLSHPSSVPPELPNLTLLKTRQYAKAHISIYSKN